LDLDARRFPLPLAEVLPCGIVSEPSQYYVLGLAADYLMDKPLRLPDNSPRFHSNISIGGCVMSA